MKADTFPQKMNRQKSKRKQSSSSNTEKLAKTSTSSTPKSQLARGDSLAEEYSNAAVDKLAQKLEKESPRKPIYPTHLPTPAPTAVIHEYNLLESNIRVE